jgi:hypothetical protein
LQGYKACFDCSVDDPNRVRQPITLVAGFIATVEHWERWESDWKLVLAHFNAPYFHMKEFFDSKKGAFTEKKWRGESYRNHFIEKLSDVTRTWTSATIGGCMTQSLFDEACRLRQVDGFLNPFSACARDCAVRSHHLIRDKYKSELPIEYVFERGDIGGDSGDITTKGLLDKLMFASQLPSPIYRRARPGNAHVEKEDPHLMQLQAADLLAWHLRRAAQGMLHRGSFAASIKSFSQSNDVSWKECTDRDMARLIHSLRIPKRVT